jgi:hypothetical protein
VTGLSWLLLLATQSSQQPDTLASLRTAARYVRYIEPRATLGFDPAIARYRRSKDTLAIPRHSDARAALIAEDLAAPIIRSQEEVCQARTQTNCVTLAIQLGAPVITGDTATVWVYARDARYSESENRKLLLGTLLPADRPPGTVHQFQHQALAGPLRRLGAEVRHDPVP